MNEPVDELYLRWLYSQVSPISVKNPSRTYWAFLGQLHRKEFVWFVPNDDNRIVEGHALRDEFIAEQDICEVDESWFNLGCSMLEMLIALSKRLSFMVGDTPREWFWRLIENLGITNCSDKMYQDHPRIERTIDEVLEIVIWRRYEANGQGGLFPLEGYAPDQRQVEIWYQMSAYLNEREGG